uniref:Uncharacterized protein n=1 Tax=Megaselia scalaris TaxID=36166 RepID=T1GEC7_MEGSC
SGNNCNASNTNSTSLATSASSINSKSNSNIPGLTAVNNLDKIKSPLNIQQSKQQSGKSNPPFPNTSPNGLNMNLFDAGGGGEIRNILLRTNFFSPPPTRSVTYIFYTLEILTVICSFSSGIGFHSF